MGEMPSPWGAIRVILWCYSALWFWSISADSGYKDASNASFLSLGSQADPVESERYGAVAPGWAAPGGSEA